MKLILLFFFFFFIATTFSQSGIVRGIVSNALNNKPIEQAKIQVLEQQLGAISNEDGSYEIKGLKPGVYSFKVVVSGYNAFQINEITVTNARSVSLDFALEEIIVEQQEVIVKANPFIRKVESPVSLKTLNATEIERLPGANRDASKVIASLPGVASRATFRNDIIIRGGSPGENKFYLDGIEVPNINHFATQGSSGGPVGLLNVNFIREVDFYSGAFPANRANGLSSVLAFKQKDGNPDAIITNFALGSSDAALTLDGPLGKKVDFIFSARKSYLQFLFAALKLPILPTYNDFQYKVNYKINQKNKLTFIGLGAIDVFRLNEKVNDNVTDSSILEKNNFILGNLPIQNQWNYTVGVNWLHYSKNSFQTIVVSRNMLNNSASRYKYKEEEIPENLLFDYSSFEAENKFRFEHNFSKNGWKLNAGVAYEYSRYYNKTYNNITVQGNPIEINFESNLFLSKAAIFGQLSKGFLNERFNLSFGLRSDINTFSKSMMNPLNQLSPSLSLNYRINEQWALNGNIARYHQLPSYTILGYRDGNGKLVNKENELQYISADHFVLGTEFLSKKNARFTLEGFYKSYDKYPFSVKDSLCLANIGSDFGIVGNEEVKSISTGRTYGMEFLYQQKLYKGFYAILAYTFVNSEFKDKNDNYVPTAWDSKHIVSLTGGKRFKKGWELGMRWLFSGGAPYTPYSSASGLAANWDINGQGILDYTQLNTKRESSFHQLNIRVDKKIFLEKFSMDFYLDIQNAYAYKAVLAPTMLVETDANGNPVIDPNDSSRYKTKLIENASGILQPTIGIIVEFAAKKKNNK